MKDEYIKWLLAAVLGGSVSGGAVHTVNQNGVVDVKNELRELEAEFQRYQVETERYRTQFDQLMEEHRHE